jgi:hypothetical protein
MAQLNERVADRAVSVARSGQTEGQRILSPFQNWQQQANLMSLMTRNIDIFKCLCPGHFLCLRHGGLEVSEPVPYYDRL